jgi:hypothetical protein
LNKITPIVIVKSIVSRYLLIEIFSILTSSINTKIKYRNITKKIRISIYNIVLLSYLDKSKKNIDKPIKIPVMTLFKLTRRENSLSPVTKRTINKE